MYKSLHKNTAFTQFGRGSRPWSLIVGYYWHHTFPSQRLQPGICAIQSDINAYLQERETQL